MVYLVILSSKSADSDYQVFNIEVEANSDEEAVCSSVDWYYQTNWSNAEWNNHEFKTEMINFRNKMDYLSKDTLLTYVPNMDVIIWEYEKQLRLKLGCTDKSFADFKSLYLVDKIDYLNDIGCSLTYAIYPKKESVKKVKLLLK
jgi:hypothetical protein